MSLQVAFMKKPILCRDLSSRYSQLRRSYYAPSAYGAHDDEDEDIELHYAPSSSLNNGGSVDDIEAGETPQFEANSPLWFRVLTLVKVDIDSIKKYSTYIGSLFLIIIMILLDHHQQQLRNYLVEQLGQMHKQHCTFTVKRGNNFSEEERQIEILTEDIKRLFVRCKQFVERIELNDQATSQEDIIKKNTKTALVMELNDLSKGFREQQQDYLQKLKALKQRKQNVLTYKSDSNQEIPPGDEDLTEEEKERIEALEQKQYDPGFTDDQIQQLIQNERENIRRDKELREILTSIVELNELFKEFSTLVVEQGSLLDRIDHNIEHTLESVKKGNKELESSEKYQKCGMMAIVVVVLAVLLLFAIIAVALKFIITFSLKALVPI